RHGEAAGRSQAAERCRGRPRARLYEERLEEAGRHDDGPAAGHPAAQRLRGSAVTGRMSAIRSVAPDLLASAELAVDSQGEGFTEITAEARRFVAQCGAGDGVLLLYLRHT